MAEFSTRDPRPPRPKPPLFRFVAWGLIIGRLLPKALELSHVRIREETPERIAELTRERHILRHPSFEDDRSYYSGIPSDLIVRSTHSFWAWADAENDEEAVEAITQKYMPSVISLLSAANGDPVRFELLRISEEEANGYMPAPRSPFSQSGNFGIREPSPLEVAEIEFVKLHDERVRVDECAASAARELATAFHIGPVTGSVPANMRGVLLHYFFVLEVISRKVGYGARERAEILGAQEPIVGRALARIQKAGSISQKIKQIHNLSLELKRLETAFFSDQVRKAAQVLNVDASATEEALELTKFRNTRLGHASTSNVGADELVPWLSMAERVAISFFRAYVDSLT
jgi:hypothetical protein